MSLEFNVVRFTPDPEEVEPVNVALLLWGSDRPRLLFDETFPRLRCIAPNVDSSLVRYYLEDLSQRLAEDATPRERIGASLSSQFQLSQPKRIVTQPTEEVLTTLKERYLRTPKMAAHASQGRVQAKLIESRLDQLLLSRLHVSGSNLMRRASPKDFLSPETYQAIGGNGIVVARAIRGPHHLMLIDGVNLGLQPVTNIELRGQHIAAAFYKMGQLRDDLARIERRDLTRATVFFGQPSSENLRRYAARMEFLRDMLRTQSDLVEDADAPSHEFIEAVARATPSVSDTPD
jgi:hypothetical protein